MIPAKRVAVIGAGPGGAIAADALTQEKVFDVIKVFERREKPGGCWFVVSVRLPPRLQLLGSDCDDFSANDRLTGYQIRMAGSSHFQTSNSLPIAQQMHLSRYRQPCRHTPHHARSIAFQIPPSTRR